uniref:Uncharacterized protein n=1 Tax=Arundo donax TaxID=35708 RepID=A0A0A9CV07_ARUDO
MFCSAGNVTLSNVPL